jgi:hypothetical protein
MKWFRANIGGGSGVALFALSIQFLLSFGHFHPDAAEIASVQGTPSTLQDSASLAAAQASAVGKTSHANASAALRLNRSSDPVPGQLGDECAICAVMALLQMSNVASAPQGLAAPQATTSRYVVVDSGLMDLNSARPAFQPRAPPIA